MDHDVNQHSIPSVKQVCIFRLRLLEKRIYLPSILRGPEYEHGRGSHEGTER